ncbi:MAG: hypothetical protein II715_05345, partial [Clostridia bacterium]|nr:hypothetical protein [Clostridia bacterium]
IYWNVVRKYNSDIMDTTREPDENGDYVFLMAYEGEQVEIKTKSRNIATQIDRQAAKVMSFEFAENGYVKKVVSASGALKGTTWGSWAHVTDVFGNQIKAEKYSGSDMGTLWEGTLADDVKIFNCSPTAEFVGIKVDEVVPTDQVHCLKDSSGEIKYVFIVSRLTDSPVYWNQVRKYDSKTKETSRTPDASGYYWFDMCVNGREIRLKTNDKEVATSVDSYAARCMGLVLEGDVILKTVSASSLTCTGRGTAASWHHIMSISDAANFHAKKTVKTASDYLHEIDVEIAPNAQIYNVSSNYVSNVGEKTTVRVGDQIHCLTNFKNQASVIFIVSRPIQSPIYWNVTRKYNSTDKASTRKLEDDGYYHIKMAVEGKQVDLKTNDKATIDKLDANGARCFGLALNGDVITKVYYPSAVVGSTGGTAGSWSDVTKINGNKIHVKKNTVGASNYGQEEDIVLAPNCKIWNVGGLYTYSGEPTKLQVGDTVHCLLNLEGQATTVFVVGRKAPDRTAVCPVCGKSVKWTGYGGSISGKEGETTHYYLTQDVTMQGQNSVGKNVTMHFDLNGFNLIAPEENRTITAWDEGSNLYIMNTKKDKSPSKIIGGKGTEPGNYGALMWLRQPGAKLTIEDVTIDASKVDQAVTRAVIYVGTGELTLKNVKIIGSKHAGEASVLYVKDIATLENVTIEGGTTDKFGNVYLASGSLTLKGDVRISGGRNDNGENANLYLAKGAKVTVEDLTCPDGSISVRMAEAGVFTNNGVASYLSKFKSDLASGSIAANASGALTWDFEITGIAFKESKLTVAAGKTLNPEIVYTPAAKNGVKLTFTSADPTVVEITSTGEILGVKESGSAGVKVTAETETGLKAETTVVVTAATDTEHYHVEGTHAEIEAGTGTKVSYTAWTETAKIPTKSGYYYLTNDIVMTNNKQPSIPAGQNVHICLNGHSITNTTEGNALTINLFDTAGETLSICDCSSGETGAVIATGSYDIQGRCLWVRANNTLNIYGGNYIGSVSTKEEIGGGTLGVEPNATLNFYGGTVKGGTSPVAAGNVYINGTFNMYGGTIEGGEA